MFPFSGIFKLGFVKAFNMVCESINKIPESYPIISVGSGNGHLEFFIRERTKRRVICIDPELDDNFSCNKIPESRRNHCIRPEYAYLKDLPNIDQYIGKCILFLSWPNPENYVSTCDKNYVSHYDYESFHKLKPALLILNYEPRGTAGSVKMLSTVIGIPVECEWKPEFYEPDPADVCNEITCNNTKYFLSSLYDVNVVSDAPDLNGKVLRLVIYTNTDPNIASTRLCDKVKFNVNINTSH